MLFATHLRQFSPATLGRTRARQSLKTRKIMFRVQKPKPGQKPSLANIDSTNCPQRISEIDKRLAELEEEKARLLSRKTEIEAGRLHGTDEI
jgi:hypothetical protein